MKYAVSELEGALLDAAVAKALGWRAEWVQDPDGIVRSGELFLNYVDEHGAGQVEPDQFSPSSEWDCGGPIIERWRIPNDGDLAAAMRAFVASKFGDTVELP